MNHRILLLPLALLVLGGPLCAADKPAAANHGYTVTLEIKVDEKGLPEDAQVISSDDNTLDRVLERTALARAKDLKMPPHLKDGHAVKVVVHAPYLFPVENDEGPDDGSLTKPKISHAVQPIYPPAMATAGTVGGAILEAMIGVDGRVADLKVLRSSDPAFAEAATTAVKQWTFVPAQKAGTAVESRWRLSISFETDVQGTDWTWRVPPRPSLGNYTIVHRTLPDEAPAPAEKPAAPPAGK